MNEKNNNWTITYTVSADEMTGCHYTIELNSKDEVLKELESINKQEGVDLNEINVYPPKTNLTATELLFFEEN